MMNNILKRLSEPSSYAGLGAIFAGVNELFKVKELEPLITATHSAADAVSATGSPIFALGALMTGLIAVFKPDKK